MANAITEWLERTGRSKTWLADELGMSRPTLYARLEDGAWDLKEAHKLAKMMGCTIESLVSREVGQ